jgi:hypothetical protein
MKMRGFGAAYHLWDWVRRCILFYIRIWLSLSDNWSEDAAAWGVSCAQILSALPLNDRPTRLEPPAGWA